jgi:Ser/Thr protein kinase RdoA (MazF antagonist)
MLMAGFGAMASQSHDTAVWAEALRRFGRIQVACAARVEELLEVGCLDRRLDRLPADVGALLDDDRSLCELEAPEAGRLRALAPRIAGMCERLASYGVPETLVHGDLNLDNIAFDGQGYTYFDWTDGCIAHPFFDLVTMLNNADEALGPLEGHQAQLRDAYLAVWGEYASIDRLRAACALALPLGALHQAVSYQHIIAGTEEAARAEWEGAIGYWLRRALALTTQTAEQTDAHS